MFGRLKNLFRKPPAADAAPEGQLLFRYHDGSRWRKADPMPLHRAVTAAWPELEPDLHLLQSPFVEAGHFAAAGAAALPNVAARVRTIFGVPAYDDGAAGGGERGLGELPCLKLLYDFLSYSGGVKKNTSPTATSTAATGGSTAPAPPPAGGPPPATSLTSDSGSAATASSAAPPTPSASASASPSGSSSPAATTTRP